MSDTNTNHNTDSLEPGGKEIEIQKDPQSGEVKRIVRTQNKTKKVKYTTKKLSKDKLDEYVKEAKDDRVRKIIIKKVQKKSPEANIVKEVKEEKVEAKKEEEETDIAAGYDLPTSDRGTITEGNLISEDWKEKKIASYKKKPEGPPRLTPYKEGTVLENRYEILEIIHEDYNGVLYMVKDNLVKDEAKQIKSIKEIQYIPPRRASAQVTQDTLKRFERMCSFLSDVEHPNLAKIHYYFSSIEKDNSFRFFIVMEFIEGNTLEDLLKLYAKEGNVLPAKTIFGIMEKIGDALYYLHNKKPFPIGFGDFRPSNVMLALDGSIKFINYGIGTVFETDEDGTIESRGTLGYSAPEQRGIDFTNTKADIYALGVTVYYMLTGMNPEENPYEFKPLRKLKRFVSEKVQRFIDRCLQVHPDERPDIGAVRKLMEKLDFHELDVASLKEKLQETKEAVKEEEPPPPPPPSAQEKVDEIITDFKAKNPLFANRYGIVAGIIILLALTYCINLTLNYIKELPRKGNYLLFTSENLYSITELDLEKGQFNTFAELPVYPGPVLYSKAKRVIYAAGPEDKKLYEISCDKKKILRQTDIGEDPSCILMSPDGAVIYVINKGTSNIYFIDTEKFAEKRSPVNLSINPKEKNINPSYASISPSGDTIFTVNEGNESVTFFETSQEKTFISHVLDLKGTEPRFICSDNRKAYIALFKSNKVLVADLKDPEHVKSEISVEVNPVITLVDSNNRKLYVIGGNSGGTIQVFDVNNYAPISKKFLGFQPQRAMMADNGKIYIIGQNTSTKAFVVGIYDTMYNEIKTLNNNFRLDFITSMNL